MQRVALGFTQAKLPALRAKLGELNAQQVRLSSSDLR